MKAEKETAALLTLGQVSLDLYRAQLAVASAKATYHDAWRSFEMGSDDPFMHVPDEYRIRRGSERWDEVIAATHDDYMVWQKSKVESSKVKRRWASACRKAADQEKD